MKKNFLRQLFCKHDYWYMGGRGYGHRTLPQKECTALFVCAKCGKVKEISYKEIIS